MSATESHRLINLGHSALLVGGMAVILWIALRAVASPGVALMAIGMFVIGALFAPRASKEMMLSLYGAKRLRLEEYPFFREALTELARRADLQRTPDLYYLPSAAPNAFATGGPSDSAVCVSDGLLRALDRRQFVAVLAHEVSHIAHGDLWIMALADGMSRLTTLMSYLGQALLLFMLPMLLLGIPVISWWAPLALIVAPVVASLLQRALSRTREFEADRGAVALTGDPEALAGALTRVDHRIGGFWEDLLLPGRRIPEPSLLRTHPPTQQRIERLRALAASARRPFPEGPLDSPAPAPAPAPRLYWTGIWR